MTQTVVNSLAGTDTLVSADILNFGEEEHNPKLAETMVNTAAVDTDSLEFDVKLTDSMFLGQPMVPPDFDIGSINLDLAAEPAPPPTPLPIEVEAALRKAKLPVSALVVEVQDATTALLGSYPRTNPPGSRTLAASGCTRRPVRTTGRMSRGSGLAMVMSESVGR